MRFILILLFIFSILDAQEEKQNITIGAGSYIQTQPYNNVDDIVLPSPVIFFDNGIAYVRWTRAGVYFYGDKQDDYAWGFSLTLQPRIYGYKSSDIPGMDERKTSWEGGLAFSAKSDKTYIEIIALTDMLDRHESWILKTEVGYDFEFENFSLYPSLILIYQSSDFLNYYYGVKKSEELGTRKEYIPNDGLQVGAQTYIKYPFSRKLSALVNLRVDKLSKEATNSPIVNDDYIYSGLLSLIYTFQY